MVNDGAILTDKKEEKTQISIPRLAKVLVVSEFILTYITTSQFYILEQVAYRKLQTLQRTTMFNLEVKRTVGAILSIVPAWLADSYTGKYWVFSSAYTALCFWPICLLVLLFDNAGDLKWMSFTVAAYFSMIYYAVEPVRFVILAEQLELPKQEDNLPMYFALLFLAQNLARSFSMVLEVIRGQDSYEFMFGNTMMLVVLFIGYVFFFMFVKKSLKGEGPVHFIYSNGIICMFSAFGRWINSRGKKKGKRKHFMDFAEKKHDTFFIYNGRVVLRLAIFGFISIFVGLTEFLLRELTFDQMSRLVPLEFLPPEFSLMDVGCVAGVLWFVIWNLIILPICDRLGWKWSLLQSFGLGYILYGLALTSAFIVEFIIDRQASMLPSRGYGQIRIFNAHSSVVALRSNAVSNDSVKWIYVPPRGLWTVTRLSVNGKREDVLTMKFFGDHNKQIVQKNVKIDILEEQSVSYIITGSELIRVDKADPLGKGVPEINDPLYPRVYVLCGLPFCFGELMFKNKYRTITQKVPDWNEHYSVFTLPLGFYNVTSVYGDYSNSVLRDIHIQVGGVYVVLVYPLTDAVRGAAFFTVNRPNSLSMTAVIPQIFILNFGFVLIRTYGFLFFYTQSPPKLRCTVWTMGPYAFAIGHSVLFLDRIYWHHENNILRITVYLLIHFVVICLLIYYAFCYTYQTWCPEGAVFQGYPPLATRYLAQERKAILIASKAKDGRKVLVEKRQSEIVNRAVESPKEEA